MASKEHRLVKQDAEFRRAAIVESARRVMHRAGIREATMRQIAEEAQATTGALYHYFKNRHHIWAAVYAEAIDETLVVLAGIDEDTRGQRLDERVREFVRRYLEHLSANRWVVDIIVQVRLEESFDAEARELMEAANEKLLERFTGFLIPPDFQNMEPVRKSARVLWALLNGLLVTFHDSPAGSGEQMRQELMSHALDLWFVMGFGKIENQ